LIAEIRRELEAWQTAWQAEIKLTSSIRMRTPPLLAVSREAGSRWLLRDTRGLPGAAERAWLTEPQAAAALTAQPFTPTPEITWALERKVGVLVDEWYVPLATAEPELLLEFEVKEGHRERRVDLARPRQEVLLMG
jgi:hypothetical protein